MVLYILIAILMFGVLIAVHEFGHFITAKMTGVKVNEFSIGMGPALLSRQKGETVYALRAFPIGGFCAMEGEDGDGAAADPRSFQNKGFWAKFLILVAGSCMNFLTGLVIVLLLAIPYQSYSLPAVGGFMEGYGLEDSGLQVGDRFLSIDGHAVWTYSDAKLLLDRAGDTVDLVVERDGEQVELNGCHIPFQEKGSGDSFTRLRGITLGSVALEATVPVKLKMSFQECLSYVRMVWMSLGDLVQGAVGLRDLSGPIGIVATVGELGEDTAQQYGVGVALQSVFSLMAFIGVNLAVMNLLPIPGLDGGRIFFLIVGWLFRLVTRKEIDPKYEGWVNGVFLMLLLGLMLVIAVSDVIKIIT
ncbi:site-2 protease family protein [Pseudoflavonifractor phocaeensis]|uniref:M50 family metallopeptidase n=1 Tax=Pseudoflavonifractor phocaeensis TaxID=1870988 RepID=UPI001956710C|nr:M50 family metallopeptidase [Pseudoflavonifractor phocaeensis]MBM6870771.1 site-2 protease family protein [Pseudoflavonifractor phocaeensis]MBM6937052.1 site-2 protease family protein [Pseudoflavonifractor phocaeensis]